MTRTVLAGLVALIGAPGCGGDRPAAQIARIAADSTPTARPVDSLALRTPSGTEVWFTASRPDTDAAGSACVERVMEIRSEGRRVAIPLLYTGSPPRVVNDSTIEAAIWLHCRPGNVYRVNLRTGQPVRVR
jgi:hypothetical protein